MAAESQYFGIDIGTATSCCYQWKNNDASPANAYSILTRSIVFLGKNTYVGEKAVKAFKKREQCILYNVKRIIGRDVFTIPQSDKDHFPYKLDMIEGRTAILLPEGNEAKRKYIFPEDVYTEIVKAVLPPDYKSIKGKKFVVVTVPEKFNDNQRAATINAVKCLGFDEVRLFSEPCAAAFSYFYNRPIDHPLTFVLFDFGGSTLDIAVINISDNNFKVLAVGGNPYMGGIDIDNKFIDLMKEKFGITEELPPMLEWSLKLKSEEIKKTLAYIKKVDIESSEIFDDYPCQQRRITLSRAELDKLIEPVLTSAVEMAYDLVAETAEYKRGEISMILLTGGSSQIDQLDPIIKNRFPKFTIAKLDQMAVARGACLRGRNCCSL